MPRMTHDKLALLCFGMAFAIVVVGVVANIVEFAR